MLAPPHFEKHCSTISEGEFREQRFLIEKQSFGQDVCNGFCRESGIEMDVLERFIGVTLVSFSGKQIHKRDDYTTIRFGKRNMPGKRARRHFSQLSEFERGLIIGIKSTGWSKRRVDGQVDRSQCGVRNCWEQRTGEVPTRGKPGMERLGRPRGKISRHLAEANLKSKHPFRALPLTPEHRQLHLQWCQARSMWNVTEWQKVVFSDESRSDDNRVRVWRRPGDGSFLNGLPVAIFQQDNNHPHTARVAQDFVLYFQTLPWPAGSPDLSPVEHVWDQLKRQMPSCHSVHDLEFAVQDL
ncbi:transposable element Tc1 transposase [Trichonephila clavipes]|nr:transposable element Tc1 transposase [Trichonephila clavipes]